MKRHDIPRSMPPRPATRGAALIITLAVLVLVTFLIMALFVTVSSERMESSASASKGDSDQLAAGVIDLVKATITQATAGYESNAGTGALDTSKRTAWASQPGLIRTWSESGTPYRSYRLYSGCNSVTDTIAVDGALDVAADAPPAGWKSGGAPYNAIWSDLNSPAATAAGLSYPIVTPPADSNAGSSAIDAANGVPTDNPATAAQEGVQGFSITNAPGYSAGTASVTNNPAPMVVKWLYVLKDGTFVSPTGTGAVANVVGASKSNPIVGRVAYWTDDETCKVNINTASEGSYWDVPKSAGKQEIALGANAPVQNEWQRIPGHPATTSLSAVFEEFSGRTAGDFQNILSLTPRAAWGGSENGTKPMGLPAIFNPGGWTYPEPTNATVPPLPTSIILPTRRLYATVDELFFSPQMVASSRTTNSNLLSEDDVARRTFFLTASSRAPDVNIFEQPRVSLWPITWINTGDWGTSRTGSALPPRPSGDPSVAQITGTVPPSLLPAERLIAFASSIGRPAASGIPYRYFFTRQLAMDPEHDFANIARNQELFDYLRDVTSRDMPGFGQSFRDKWGTDETTQILASCFDHIRGAVNLNTAIYKSGAPNNLATNSYFYTPLNARQSGIGTDPGGFMQNARLAGGQVLPINIRRGGFTAHGAGRTPIITEAALVFYAKQRQDPVTNIITVAGSNIFQIDATKLIGPSGSQTTQLGCFLLLEMFNPVVGRPLNSANNYAVRVSGQPFSVNGNSLDFPSPSGDINLVSGEIDSSPRRDSRENPTTGFHTPLVGTVDGALGRQGQKIAKKGGFSDKYYPFFGEVAVLPSATSFSFSGSQVTIEITAPNTANRAGGNPSSAPVFQTYNLDFSQLNGSYPMPRAPRFNAAPGTVNSSTFDTNSASPTFGLMNTNVSAFQRGQPTPHYKASDGSLTNLTLPINLANSVIITNSIPMIPNDEVVTAKAESGTNVNFKWYYQFTDQLGTNNCGFLASDKVGSNIDADVRTSIQRSHTDLNFRLWFTATSDAIAAGGVSPASCLITPYDTIISLSLDGYGPALGDPRLVASAASVPQTWYRPIDPRLRWFPIFAPQASTTPSASGTNSYIPFTAPTATVWRHLLVGGAAGGTAEGSTLATPSGRSFYQNFMPTNFSLSRVDFEGGGSGVSGRFRSLNSTALPGAMDWTGGDGGFADGAIIDKPFELFFPVSLDVSSSRRLLVPFFTNYELLSDEARFSPNSQIVSAVQFGSLPSGAVRGLPWQTLLFSPNPAAGSSHPGLVSPPDHLLLDLFSMPVVEPYPISEPLSTAGRINLNYQIAPFTHIVRKTGPYALLKSLQMPILTKVQSANYKYLPEMNRTGWSAGSSVWEAKASFSGGTNADGGSPEPSVSFPALGVGTRTRYSINIDETLKGFDEIFTNDGAFRSASEICNMFLVPRTDDADPASTTPIPGIPTTLVDVRNGWWTSSNADNSPTITGDNLRESPYNQLYPRVTTKSNTFTVHYRVQALKQAGNRTDWATWNEATDQVLSESRGSATIERYVDPNDTSIPDFARSENYSKNLAPCYRWRTLAASQFIP